MRAATRQITVHNRGPEAAPLHVLPQVWFRNTWSWTPGALRPTIAAAGDRVIKARHPELGEYQVSAEGQPTLLFCDNDNRVYEDVAGKFFAACRTSASAWSGSSAPGPTSPRWSPAGRSPAAASAGCCRSYAATA